MEQPRPSAAPDPSEALPGPDRRLQDLHIILDVARAMAAPMTLDDLLAMIVDSVRRVLAAERATLFLYDPAANELFSKIVHGTGEIRLPADKGIVGAAVQGRQTINIPDAYADPRFHPDIDRRTGFRTRCLLTVPLTGFENRLVGALQALNKVGGVFNRYDEHLAEALAAHIGVALERARLINEYLLKKELENSLALARSIQQNLLPRQPPSIPGYELAGWCRPADATGGDYYDFIPLPRGVAVAIADATGHGIGPALEIAETRALFRAISGYVAGPGDILARANTCLCHDLTPGRFVTAFLGVLDPAAHRLEYASAGHGPLFWYRRDQGAVTTTHATGLPLGILEPFPSAPAPPVHFAPGDLGVFLTDGFIEARDPDNQQFGQERVARVIIAHAGHSAAQLIDALAAAVSDFMHTGPQLDDLTALVVKRTG